MGPMAVRMVGMRAVGPVMRGNWRMGRLLLAGEKLLPAGRHLGENLAELGLLFLREGGKDAGL